IKVPLAHPELASIVSSPRIFNDLTEAATHAEAPEDIAAAAKAAAEARAQGGFTATIRGIERVAPSGFIQPLLDSIVKARQGTGAPTGADSAALRGALQRIVDALVGGPPPGMRNGVRPGPTQCHDITVYPAIGLAGGACGGCVPLVPSPEVAHPEPARPCGCCTRSDCHSAAFRT